MLRYALLIPLLAGGCAGPSKAQMEQANKEAARITSAAAVHMPPKGVDSCVGVTLRLADTPEAEDAHASKLTDPEIETSLAAAGLKQCRDNYLDGLEMAALTPETLRVSVGYGVDPAGRVCAVVQGEKTRSIDPSVGPLFDVAATCLRDVLFRAQLPAGRVEDKQRIVKVYHLMVEPPAAVRTSTQAAAGTS